MRLLAEMDVVPCSTLGAQTGAAPLTTPASAAPASATNAQLQFVASWKSTIAPKLHQLLSLLQSKEVATSLAIAQIWTYLPVLTEGRQLLKAEQLCLLGDVALQPFHAGCVEQGVTVGQLGPMGKVWENGAVQVVQYAESLPEDTHPRNRLPGGLSRRIGECIYAPVYDQTGQVSQGVVAVVELLVRSQSCDYMVVANAISCLTHLMESLQLSISSPQAPQQQQAAAAAAGAMPPGKRAAAAPPPQPSHAAMQAGMARNGSSMQSTTVWGSGGSNGGSSLGRTVSMHTFSG